MTRVERYERLSEIPVIMLAVAFLIAYAWPVLDPQMQPNLRSSLKDLPSAPVLHAVAIDAHGHHAGITTTPRRHYLAWEQGRSSYSTVECARAT